MKECINRKFILDSKVVDCDHFYPDLINKGISLYEVIRVVKGRFLFEEDHIRRLSNSACLARLDLWHTEEEISGMISRLPHLNKISEGNVKIVFNFLNGKKNHFLAYFVQHRYPDRNDYENGVKIITFPFTREDPNKKIWQPDFRTTVHEMIRKENVYEVLLVDENSFITEASRANFFTILHGTVYTPPAEKVLNGTTRKYVLLICRKQNIPVFERDISVNEMKEHDAVFLTGTSPGVLPVAEVDSMRFEVKDRVLRLLMSEYEKLVEKNV
jgi:branched-chain amino acid aminotransferase